MTHTLLLIEDNPHIMQINQQALMMQDYHVRAATTIAEGRALFARERPDLILLDVMLPDGSGFSFCEEVRLVSDVPILFLSALGDTAQIARSTRVGGNDYLVKPYDLDVLIDRIEALLPK